MLGNIWISSALVVIAIFSTGAIYKSYSDIKEAKQIQEHYEIVKDIKTKIALQYNLNPDEITRDDIIAHLPKGENWEKILLLDRDKSSNISNKELINAEGNITISADERLKVLALRAKLKDIQETNFIVNTEGNIDISIKTELKNLTSQEKRIDENLKKAIDFLIYEIIYNNKNTSDTFDTLTTVLEDKEFFDYSDIVNDFGKTSEIDIINAKKDYLKSKLKEELLKNPNASKSTLYERLKDL
jgi:hypothetical protein